MKIADWLSRATAELRNHRIDSARLDALVLLSDELGRDKSWVLAHNDDELSPVNIAVLDEKLARRSSHEPLAYIRGHVEFYGRKFAVSRAVLVPRPESESIISLLINVVKHLPENSVPRVIDIGTGSGCLAITAKCELPFCSVVASDIDKQALDVARQNAEALNAEIDFVKSNLLNEINMDNQSLTIILANLPYVPNDYAINEDAKHEPEVALFSGYDGLDHYRQLFAQASLQTAPPQYVITESLFSQHKALEALAQNNGYGLRQSDGLAQLFVRE